MLEPYRKCPHCGATQRWGTHVGTAIVFTLLALGCLALFVPCIAIYQGEGDLTWLAIAALPLLLGAAFAIRAAMDWKELLSAGPHSGQKPEVLFGRMASPWLDQLKD